MTVARRPEWVRVVVGTVLILNVASVCVGTWKYAKDPASKASMDSEGRAAVLTGVKERLVDLGQRVSALERRSELADWSTPSHVSVDRRSPGGSLVARLREVESLLDRARQRVAKQASARAEEESEAVGERGAEEETPVTRQVRAAVSYFRATFLDRTLDPLPRIHALRALRAFPRDAHPLEGLAVDVDEFYRTLRTDEDRAETLESLDGVDDAELVETFLRGLDGGENLRSEAVGCLERFTDLPRVRRHLEVLAAEDPSERVRARARRALSRHDGGQ